MKINEGNTLSRGKISLVDIECSDNYDLFVFQGNHSKNDIIVKYKNKNGNNRIRTPRHIHWVVDILMKLQAEEILTKAFLNEIKKDWINSVPLKDNGVIAIKTVLADSNVELTDYQKLNSYGEYDIDFLYSLLKLIMVQEKTDDEDAYMFGDIIDKLLEDKIDLFSIMSTAGYNGR